MQSSNHDMKRKTVLLTLLFLSPLAFYPFLCDRGPTVCPECELKPPTRSWSPEEKQIGLVLANFGALPGQAYPAAAVGFCTLPELAEEKTKTVEVSLKAHPIAFLEDCLQHYQEHVQGYRLTFVKQEKVAGKLMPKEKIRVHFREKPFSVHFHWLEGAGQAVRTLWVDGENDNKLLARPTLEFLGIWSKSLSDPAVLKTSRFPITEFGIQKGAQSTVAAMYNAKDRDKLFVRYDGIKCVKELGDRYCYKLVRTPYDPPELDGINELTIFIDCELLMQTGSILKDAKGELIAEYWFRDIELNPAIDAKIFSRKGI